MRRKLLTFGIVFIIFLGSLIEIFSFEEMRVTALNDPTQPSDGGTVYVNGDWEVTDVREYYNCTIIMNGSLIIQNGGSLTIRNVTLIMNNTYNGKFDIEVQSGGAFYVYDFDNSSATNFDRSNITSANPNNHYMFWVREGANFIMKNSELHECGWNWSNPGLTIESEKIILSGNKISDNREGIYLWYSLNNTIINNTIFSNNWVGIDLRYSSGNTIVNNTIYSILYCGIEIHYSSKNILTNNKISNNEVGIHAYDSSNNTIAYNNISSNNEGISLGYSSNNTVVDNYILNNSYGIDISLSTNNTIANNNLSNNSHGIYLDKSLSNAVVNNTIFWSTKDGIFLSNSSGNIITNNTVFNNSFGVYLDGSLSNRIVNNTFTDDGIIIFGYGLQHFIHDIDTSNKVNGKPVYYFLSQSGITIDKWNIGQLFLVNCTNSTIQNVSIANTDVGIELAFTTNTTITNASVANNRYGTYIVYSSNNTIANNTISNDWRGLYLSGSSKNILANNTISKNYYGIGLDSSSNNTLNNNIISLDNDIGIYLGYSSNNNIANNIIFDNYRGIFLSFSSSNPIANNNISNNLLGIILSSSSNNPIVNNNISFNNNGVFVWDSVNNTIYHNNLINNGDQAIDNTNNGNQWDNGYSLGGNFWSDYMGVDKNKGPNQDIPGSDGIGDTKYWIDIDSFDFYPLMEPYKPLENYTILKQGWNLISIPLIQEEQSLTKVLEMIDGYYDAVQWYDSTDINDPWKHYKVGKPFGNDLFLLNETMGFWIHITQPGDTIFIYNGTQPSFNQTITLSPGWNLVGYPSLTSYNRTEGLNNLTFGLDVDAIWTYNATTQKWKEITASDNFEVGRGYWIHSKVTKTWDVSL